MRIFWLRKNPFTLPFYSFFLQKTNLNEIVKLVVCIDKKCSFLIRSYTEHHTSVERVSRQLVVSIFQIAACFVVEAYFGADVYV